jgi:hypothetical protein
MPLDQNQYVHAMAEDPATGKPMPKVSIAGADSSSGALGVDVKSSQIIQPVDVQARYSQTIQTHNAVSVPTLTLSVGTWIDAGGFDKLAYTAKTDVASHSWEVSIEWSHDGVSVAAVEYGGVTSNQYKLSELSTKARYARLRIYNNDAVTHVMSMWAHLKA